MGKVSQIKFLDVKKKISGCVNAARQDRKKEKMFPIERNMDSQSQDMPGFEYKNALRFRDSIHRFRDEKCCGLKTYSCLSGMLQSFLSQC